MTKANRKSKSQKTSNNRVSKKPVGGKITRIPVRALALSKSFSDSEKELILNKINSILDGNRPINDAVRKSLIRTINTLSSNSNVGPTNLSDDVMSIRSAPHEIPAVALSGFQFLERRVRVTKLATSGTAAGGFYASLLPTDFSLYTTSLFRIKKITSWTASVNSGTDSQFAGLNTLEAQGSSGTEALPSWTEDFTRIGNGYAGVEVSYPMGDFLLFADTATAAIANHYTSLGGTGGVTGIPVVFDVIAEVCI